MVDFIETIIIGGGQAGLATSYYLGQMGREHLVLEQARYAGNTWRNQRWDSFTFVTPNWMIQLPGAGYQGDDPDGYLLRDEIVRYFEEYVERYRFPVRYGVRASSVERNETGYRVRTEQGDYQAANVVIATGFFQKPKLPAFSAKLPGRDRTTPYQRIPQPQPTACRRGAGGRVGAVGLPDRRGAVPERAQGVFFHWRHRPGAAPLSREGYHLVVV